MSASNLTRSARLRVSLRVRMSAVGGVVGEIGRRPAGLVGLLGVCLFVVIALVASKISPHSPIAIDAANIYAPPSSAHWLGTDGLGRDVASRLIYGSRTALSIVLPAVFLGFVPGVALGLAAGYLGGPVDKIIIVCTDTLLSFPSVILAIAVLTLTGPSKTNVILLLAIALLPSYARLARAQTLAVKKNTYMLAEAALGASRTRIILRHILPNVIPSLLVLVTLDFPGAIAFEAGLAFLGIGVQPPTSDWGVMLNDGFVNVRTDSWPLIGPLLALMLVTTSFTLLGEALRDVMDPRLPRVARGGRFRFIGAPKP